MFIVRVVILLIVIGCAAGFLGSLWSYVLPEPLDILASFPTGIIIGWFGSKPFLPWVESGRFS